MHTTTGAPSGDSSQAQPARDYHSDPQHGRYDYWNEVATGRAPTLGESMQAFMIGIAGGLSFLLMWWAIHKLVVVRNEWREERRMRRADDIVLDSLTI